MEAIVFFDAHCLLCRKSINFLYRHDRKKRLHFAPLEGKIARAHLPPYIRGLNTVVLLELPSKRLSIRARAVFRTLRYLGKWWKCVSWMQYLPFVDSVYRLIARHRRRGGRLPAIKAKLLS